MLAKNMLGESRMAREVADLRSLLHTVYRHTGIHKQVHIADKAFAQVPEPSGVGHLGPCHCMTPGPQG